MENLELHHIVPFKLGGTNKPSNITCLCNPCHKAVTFGGHATRYRSHSHNGRKPTVSREEAFCAYDQWSKGDICTTELKEALKMGEGTHVKEGKWYPTWKEERGIKEVQNLIERQVNKGGRKRSAQHDARKWRESVVYGSLISKIWMKDGSIHEFHFT